MFAQFADVLRHNLGKALAAMGLGSALLGAVLTDFASWRSVNREFMKHQIEVSEQADRDLLPLLRKFSDKALGRARTSSDDLDILKARVSDSYIVANKIVQRLPKAQHDFRSYADSLINLQKCAEEFEDALDSKCWVIAISSYAAKKKAFEEKVATLQTSWP